MIVDFEAPNPHYSAAMRLCDVKDGVSFVLFNPHLGLFWDFQGSIVNTLTGTIRLHWLTESRKTYVVVGVEKSMYKSDFFYADDAFTVRQARHDTPPYIMVAVEKNAIKGFHNWLVRKGHTRAAIELKSIQPEWFEPERNPRFEHAATIKDFGRGTELLKISLISGSNPITAFTSTGMLTEIHLGSMGNHKTTYVKVRVLNETHDWSLAAIGVIPLSDDNWTSQQLTIVNTPEKRRELVKWLLEQSGHKSVEVASKILELYPTDFTAKVTAKDGELVAEVI